MDISLFQTILIKNKKKTKKEIPDPTLFRIYLFINQLNINLLKNIKLGSVMLIFFGIAFGAENYEINRVCILVQSQNYAAFIQRRTIKYSGNYLIYKMK